MKSHLPVKLNIRSFSEGPCSSCVIVVWRTCFWKNYLKRIVCEKTWIKNSYRPIIRNKKFHKMETILLLMYCQKKEKFISVFATIYLYGNTLLKWSSHWTTKISEELGLLSLCSMNFNLTCSRLQLLYHDKTHIAWEFVFPNIISRTFLWQWIFIHPVFHKNSYVYIQKFKSVIRNFLFTLSLFHFILK